MLFLTLCQWWKQITLFYRKLWRPSLTYKRKNSIPDTDAIYKELKEDCASNINVVDIESQIKLMIDNGLLENRPNNQGLNSFFILNSNIQI